MDYTGLLSNLEKKTKNAFEELRLRADNITNASSESYKVKRLNEFDKAIHKISQGQLEATKNPHDVTLEGAGFFQLFDREGNTYLSRNLHLATDKDHNIMSHGKYLFPEGTLSQDFVDFRVSESGEIIGKALDGSKVPLGNLTVVHYPAAQELDFDGVLYKPTAEAGQPTEISVGEMDGTKIRQKYKELSNVSMPFEFMGYSQVNQKLRLLTSLMQTINQSRRQYVQTIGQMAG